MVDAGGPDPLDQTAVRRWLKVEHGVPQNSQWAIADAAARAVGGSGRPSRATSTRSTPGPRRRCARSTTGSPRSSSRSAPTSASRAARPARRSCAPASSRRSHRRRGRAVDLGLRFTDPPASSRLLTTSPVGQCTHRVALTDVDEVDDEVGVLLAPRTSRTAESSSPSSAALRLAPTRFARQCVERRCGALGSALAGRTGSAPGSRARAEPSRKA